MSGRYVNDNAYIAKCRELGIEPDPGTVARHDQLAEQMNDVCGSLQAYINSLTPGHPMEGRRWQDGKKKRWWRR